MDDTPGLPPILCLLMFLHMLPRCVASKDGVQHNIYLHHVRLEGACKRSAEFELVGCPAANVVCDNWCSGHHLLIDGSIKAVGFAKAQVPCFRFFFVVKTDDVGEGNAGASPHVAQDDSNLVEARGRRVHIN